MKILTATLAHFYSDDNVSGLMSNFLLAQIASGEIDFKRIAELTLAGRGCDQNGKWVGFQEAAKQFDITDEF